MNLEINNFQRDFLIDSLGLYLDKKLKFQKKVSSCMSSSISSELLDSYKTIYNDVSNTIEKVNLLLDCLKNL